MSGAVASPVVRTARVSGAKAPSPKARTSVSYAARLSTDSGRIVASGALNRTWMNGNPEDEKDPEGREEDGERAAHDPAGEARPGALAVRRGGRLPETPDRQGIDARPEDREDRRQERERRGDGDPDDEGAGDPDRAEDHELEEDEPEEAEEDGETGEEDGAAGGRDGDPDRGLDRRLVGGDAGRCPSRQLLAEAAEHEERVVDPEAQPEERGEVEDEDAHRGDAGEPEDARERDQDGGAADGERNACGDDRAEDEEERERCQREADQFAAAEVGLRDGLDVAVEGGASGRSHPDAVDRHQRLP